MFSKICSNNNMFKISLRSDEKAFLKFSRNLFKHNYSLDTIIKRRQTTKNSIHIAQFRLLLLFFFFILTTQTEAFHFQSCTNSKCTLVKLICILLRYNTPAAAIEVEFVCICAYLSNQSCFVYARNIN